MVLKNFEKYAKIINFLKVSEDVRICKFSKVYWPPGRASPPTPYEADPLKCPPPEPKSCRRHWNVKSFLHQTFSAIQLRSQDFGSGPPPSKRLSRVPGGVRDQKTPGWWQSIIIKLTNIKCILLPQTD